GVTGCGGRPPTLDPASRGPGPGTSSSPIVQRPWHCGHMRPDNLDELLEDLRNYHADLEAPELRAELVDACLPRLLATLEMLPESVRSADILELGATPFFLTLCLRRLCSGRL